MLLVAALLGMAVIANAQSSSSSSSYCFPTETSVQIPSSVQEVISSIENSVPSLVTIGMAISTFGLLAPTMASVEEGIEHYMASDPSLVIKIESMYEYPSMYTPETISEITNAYPTLAEDVSGLMIAALTEPVLAEYQSTLQQIEIEYPSIITLMGEYTDCWYPQIASASEIISKATLTNPTIFGDALAIATAVYASPTISTAMYSISTFLYTLPSSVVTEIVTFISSPSTIGSTTAASLESCYPSAMQEVSNVLSFTYEHPSKVSDLTKVIYADSSVKGFNSAVETIASYEMPTFVYEASVLSHAENTNPAISIDLKLMSNAIAKSPTLAYAESQIEASFCNSPSIGGEIYEALVSPSAVTDPSAISQYEESHISLVNALNTVISYEKDHPSSASTIQSIEYSLVTAFTSQGTLITAHSFVEDITSPSQATASVAVSLIKSVMPDITTVLGGIVSVITYEPSLSCAESVVEYYDTEYPTTVYYLWEVIDGYYYLSSSSASYFEYLEGEYTTLFTNMLYIYTLASDTTYPFSYSLESSFIYAAAYDSSILTEYMTFYDSSSADSISFWSVQSSFSGDSWSSS